MAPLGIEPGPLDLKPNALPIAPRGQRILAKNICVHITGVYIFPSEENYSVISKNWKKLFRKVTFGNGKERGTSGY